MSDLFREPESMRTRRAGSPLANRMRPRTLDEFVGQPHLVGPEGFIRLALRQNDLPSIILWGPPGTGKTTLAQILSSGFSNRFISISAVLSGVAEARKIMAEAQRRWKLDGSVTLLFIDEIHRFNKAQQDAFLAHIENGSIVLVGATTENPSFEVISPLLSRCRVLVLDHLSEQQLRLVLQRALDDGERGLANEVSGVEQGVLPLLAGAANGDARFALNSLEIAATFAPENKDGFKTLTKESLVRALQNKSPLYDKRGEENFNLISALHKSIRSSDPDAALYWLARMIEGGADPLYLARRIVRIASEDVGNADPSALRGAIAARDAVHFLGFPEGDLALAQAVVYLAVAPKSDAVYRAWKKARTDARDLPPYPVPASLRNAPTSLLRELDYGKGYEHAHDLKDRIPAMDCLPTELSRRTYYTPKSVGVEERIEKRLREIRRIRERKRGGRPR